MPHGTNITTAVCEVNPTAKHVRVSSFQIIPLIAPSAPSKPKQLSSPPLSLSPKNLWTFDDTSDEEVPAPSMIDLSMRQARARAHVQGRLRELQHEEHVRSKAFAGKRSVTSYELVNMDGSLLLLGSRTLGVISPSCWRTIDESFVLDRKWLHEINPASFDEEGLLRAEHAYMKRPSCVPPLYWNWINGNWYAFNEPEKWASGWSSAGPTIQWIERWKTGKLTTKEVTGRRRVSFVLENEVTKL